VSSSTPLGWSVVSRRPQRARSARRARSLCPFAACPADSSARLAVSHCSANSATDGAGGGAGRLRFRAVVLVVAMLVNVDECAPIFPYIGVPPFRLCPDLASFSVDEDTRGQGG